MGQNKVLSCYYGLICTNEKKIELLFEILETQLEKQLDEVWKSAEFLLAWRSHGWEPFRDREESSTASLLPELQFSIYSITRSYARTAATSAHIGLTVHRARSDHTIAT